MTDAERYLAKARESLASAEADLAARRYNSCANRAYYAAFQAAVSALIHVGIRPENGNWQHRFVLSQFSGTLVRRRKLLASELPAAMDRLFRVRVIGDYEPRDVSQRAAKHASDKAAHVISEVERMRKLRTFREASARYEAEHPAERSLLPEAEGLVTELQGAIKARIPGADFDVIRLGQTDYRLRVYVDTEDEEEAVNDALGSRTSDILVDHDIWIVVLPQRREQAA